MPAPSHVGADGAAPSSRLPFHGPPVSTAFVERLASAPKPGHTGPMDDCGTPGEARVMANGRPVAVRLPCTLEAFLVSQKLLPRSVVVEHNGAAVAPSEFAGRLLGPGDRLEIVRIVAGG